MMTPKITPLNNLELMQSAHCLPKKGILAINKQIVYINIEDNYIHQLFPLLKNEKIRKPDYFKENAIGAHITVIYPEEYRKFDGNDLGVEHNFFIKNLISAKIRQKTYYAILVESPSLLDIRKKYRLPELLCFKGYQIGFHITIGVEF